MQDADKILEALRPAHLPAAEFGLTFGDLALPIALGLLAAILVAVLWPTRIKGGRRVSLSVMQELERSRALPAEEARLAQARLLRRVVAARDGESAATLKGLDFAAHLDKSFGTDFFTSGPGRSLTLSLYEPPPPAANTNDADAVGKGLEGLFRRLRA